MSSLPTLEYLNVNTLRSFPLCEGCSVTSSDGWFSIPQSVIVDAQFSVDTSPHTRLHISKWANLGGSFSITVTKVGGGDVGTFTVDQTTHTYGASYVMTPTVDFKGAFGRIQVAYLDALVNQPSGTFFFDPTAAVFELTTVAPSTTGVTSVIVKDTRGQTATLTDAVILQANANLLFKSVGDAAYLTAGDGLGLNAPCEFDHPILTINGIGPDEHGNFTIEGIDCVTIVPGSASIQLVENCCAPCSSCDSLDVLKTRVKDVEQDFVALRSAYDKLIQQVMMLVIVPPKCQ